MTFASSAAASLYSLATSATATPKLVNLLFLLDDLLFLLDDFILKLKDLRINEIVRNFYLILLLI
jgi:hypothetical protein